MTRLIGCTAMALSLSLAACGDGAPQQNRVEIKAGNPVSDQLKGMSELYRYLGLRRAIVDSGLKCKKVDSGAYQEDYKNMALWTAHCTDSGDWGIFIAPNSDVQVRRCRDMKQLGLPECRMPAPAQGQASEKR